MKLSTSVETFKQQVNSRSDCEYPVNTQDLQVLSLCKFMSSLGYYPMDLLGDKVGTCGFYNMEHRTQVGVERNNTKFLSTEDAMRLHNGVCSRQVSGDIPWIDICSIRCGRYLMNNLKFTQERFKKALDSKLVKRIYLQLDKKSTTGFKVQPYGHWIELNED